MAEQGNGLGCPVCDGAQMTKLRPSDKLELTLDYCDTCGGMWFESGEVRQLRLLSPEVLSSLITVKKQLYAVDCPSCGHPITRNSSECGSCGKENTVDCPTCGSELERVQSERFTVDVCRDCRGVWFDNIDLSQVWNLQFEHSKPDSSKGREGDTTADTVVAILRAGGAKGGGKRDGEGEGEGNVFGTIADIIGGIFSPGD